MVISAQFRLAGFYDEIVRRSPRMQRTRRAAAVGRRRRRRALRVLGQRHRLPGDGAHADRGVCARHISPVPFLLALACAANAGSAATLIGNPQNMFIGQSLHLSFAAICSTVLLRRSPAWR
jgi:di/tricarboxylate transporter